MTKVEFYILQDEKPHAAFRRAVELIQNVYNDNKRVFVHTQDQRAAERMDELLWTHEANSFLPHLISGEASGLLPPIQIGYGQEPEIRPDVLINLSDEIPRFHGQFATVVEFAHGDEDTKAKARERFKYYRDRGYPLQHFQG
ncbi:DNA polymerase III subunit chi [Pleionea sp. CnH1-48]|uniref:DNA polymerase III subunit chi n=1 Tax=Pleionea sp. CnH1-48 TaxID=2954494 RepID=UPI002096B5F0|nr:DNA polymerase III subunit chi [Pleionea sp. CnH1-48]MCO7225367.1 DNA polymerase III subunit chi [Pleionea sp. CnH1-48]